MRPVLKIFLAVSLFFSLASGYAHVSAEPEGKSPITAQASWQEGRDIALGERDAQLTSSFPQKRWWVKFHDPWLTQYIDKAVQYNNGLRAAIIRIQEARAEVQESAAAELPSTNLSPAYYRVNLPHTAALGSHLPFPSVLNLMTLPFQASYELDLFGRNRNRVQSAEKEADATELDGQAALISLTGDVAGAYFNLIRMDALVQSQTENLQLLSRVHALKQSQNRMGLVSSDEVIRADRDVMQAQTNLANFRQQQALYAHQLSILTGNPPVAADRLPRTPMDSLALPTEIESGIPSDLVTRRPDVLAQEKRLEKAHIDVTIARKAFLPTINLGNMLGYGGTQLGKLVTGNNLFNLFSTSVSQPLFQGGKLDAQLKYRKAVQREQLENYHQTLLNALKEVEDNLALLRADFENLDSNRKRMDLTAHDLALRQNLYEQGLSPHLDVLQAQSEMIGYQQINIQSRGDAAIAVVNLYKALGGGF